MTWAVLVPAPGAAATGERQAVSGDAIQALELELVAALAAAPENAAAADSVFAFYQRWGARLDAPAAAALDLVARARDPAGLALRLAGHPRSHAHSIDFLLAALAVRPEAAVLWAAGAQATSREDWKIAFLEQSLRCLAHPGSDPRPEEVPAAAAVAERWLGEMIAAGLAPQAMAALARLPPAVRTLIEEGAAGPVATEIGGLPFTGELHDLRPDLAVVELLRGNTPEARRLLLAMPPRRGRQGAERAPATAAVVEQAVDLKRRLLERWLSPSRPEDPFSLYVEVLRVPPAGLADGLRPACWRLALAQAAQREGYPAIATFVLFQAARWLGDALAGGEPTRTGRGVPPSVLVAARGLGAEIAALTRQLDTDARAARAAMRAGLGPDPAAAAIARLLREPPGPHFTARPLAALLPASPPAMPGPVGRHAAPALRPRLPGGFTAVRVERQGKRVTVVALSEDYDRAAPASRGGYWVLRSDEPGTTWSAPLYTGLRDNLPYTVRATSIVPLLAGNRLQVEVEIKEVLAADPAAADLPPRQPLTGIYLDVPLAELERDSDGDGLTDLAEQRLLTDPRHADTDRDGLADGEDPTPTIATTDPPAPEAGALAVILAETVDKPPPRAAARLQAGSRGGCCLPGPARPFGERTVFVQGERPMFAGLRPAHRLIVLAPEEVEALERIDADPCSLTLELVALERSGRRAFVVWSTSNRESMLLLERRDGAWQPANAAPAMD